jgi:hypothetical protein
MIKIQERFEKHLMNVWKEYLQRINVIASK